jgi:hypothetical protein
VQELVILEDDVRDVLAALQEAQREEVEQIEQVQLGLEEHGLAHPRSLPTHTHLPNRRR